MWMLVSFGILVFILAKWGWPMLLKSLKKREEAIVDSLNAAEKAREEMEKLKNSNQDLLREAKAERDEILRSARLTSENIIEEARQRATAEADRIVENARENINYEKLKAMHELKNQIGNLSIEIAEKVLQRELSDKNSANAFVQSELENIHLN